VLENSFKGGDLGKFCNFSSASLTDEFFLQEDNSPISKTFSSDSYPFCSYGFTVENGREKQLLT
jgi:hypothetical protein